MKRPLEFKPECVAPDTSVVPGVSRGKGVDDGVQTLVRFDQGA
jgi:hypothetical protein